MFCPGPGDSSGPKDHVPAPLNVLTIDVEEYFHTAVFQRAVSDARRACLWRGAGQGARAFESRCAEPLSWLLDVLEARRQRATFFCLGVFAESHPRLIKQIARRGHEVACHGHEHRSVKEMDPGRFRDDVLRASDAIVGACGQVPVGYRAPGFSLGPGDRRHHEVLRDLGFRYDSSVFPVALAGPDHARAARLPWGICPGLWELPVAVAGWGPVRLPLGGVFFRALPYRATAMALSSMNKDKTPAMLYFHPWEFDDGQPRLAGIGPVDRVRQYWGLAASRDKFARLCAGFRFMAAVDALDLLA
ncbi:MAG: polysaccharide deacetylase family protein [Bacillota bacterium]|nr:polysaccharide deacetylase family protein [Bacillota bacterium]